MLRVGTSVMLMVAQLATVCAAPLAVCTDATGNQCLDFGAASCVRCHTHEDACSHEHHGGLPCEDGFTLHGDGEEQPCDCEHRLLVDESQVVRRTIWDIVMIPSLDAAAADRIDARVTAAVAWSALVSPSGSHSDLLDLKTVCLRC